MTQPTHPVPGPWTIRYELATNPLTLNASRQGSFRKNATWTKKIRRQTESRVERIHNIPVLGRCVVQLTWFVLTNGRRDVDNLAKLEKAMFDGVVDARSS
jgi:crossover junction endodeoxyribonuclease RusA